AEKRQEPELLPPPRPALEGSAPVLAPSILNDAASPIDLASALELAGVENPEILIARQRVVEAVALRQLAAAQILPTLNLGTNFDNHNGPLQRANGSILEVNRSALYVGLGAGAVGAGTVNIPGLVWNGNVSRTFYGVLVSRQIVQAREFGSDAVRNDTLLRVAQAYLELLRAQGRRVVAIQIREEAREVARVTANYAQTGQGRQADADRAATELEQRNNDLLRAEGDILVASARLCQLLHIDPSVRLHGMDGWAVPAPLVPDPIPLPELIAIALTQRPELRERQAVIRAALLQLKDAKCLPFSPNLIVGYSAGTFGGGSNLAAEGIAQPDGTVLRQPRFDSFAGRQDFDAVVYWSLRNLGVGNVAMIRLAGSNLRSEQLREIVVLDRVRAEVASAYAATHARFAQIETSERAVQSGQRAFREDLIRTRNREGLPIEVLDSLRLSARSRYAYLDAIIDYNRAQFELYVALGQPPAHCLARPVPPELVAPPPPPCPPAPSR
ncbi:MAG: TolC family protein, partial [Gemmataceae bacterium]|nr:TolC family protein [Gemmataceae bacterium]